MFSSLCVLYVVSELNVEDLGLVVESEILVSVKPHVCLFPTLDSSYDLPDTFLLA